MCSSSPSPLKKLAAAHTRKSTYHHFLCIIVSKLFTLKSTRTFFILAFCWFLVCTILLCLPGSAFPKETWLNKIWFDKWVHIGIFSVMTFLWSVALVKKNGWPLQRTCLLIALCAITYGVTIEFVQKYFIPNRSFDVFDIMADTIGSLLGYLSAVSFLKRKTPVETGVVNQN